MGKLRMRMFGRSGGNGHTVCRTGGSPGSGDWRSVSEGVLRKKSGGIWQEVIRQKSPQKKMRRRQWVREGDLIVVQPWDFQDEKANVCMRYTKTQSLYLSRKGALPEIVDLFGLSDEKTNLEEDISENIDDEIQETVESPEESTEKVEKTPPSSNDEDDIDSFFG